MDGWRELLKGAGKDWTGKAAGVFDAGDGKVPDGLRYHVLDIWVDGLLECDDSLNRGVLEPVQRLAKEGKTKVLRTRANNVLVDERLLDLVDDDDEDGEEAKDLEDDFEGFDE